MTDGSDLTLRPAAPTAPPQVPSSSSTAGSISTRTSGSGRRNGDLRDNPPALATERSSATKTPVSSSASMPRNSPPSIPPVTRSGPPERKPIRPPLVRVHLRWLTVRWTPTPASTPLAETPPPSSITTRTARSGGDDPADPGVGDPQFRRQRIQPHRLGERPTPSAEASAWFLLHHRRNQSRGCRRRRARHDAHRRAELPAQRRFREQRLVGQRLHPEAGSRHRAALQNRHLPRRRWSGGAARRPLPRRPRRGRG